MRDSQSSKPPKEYWERQLMDVQQATKAYEFWLRQRIPVIAADFRVKHQRMAESSFSFLRATFYRWVQLWPKVCPELASAPVLLGVGDLHVENFGTWRDCEGRLIWGINDFDEVAHMPYTVDLVRLAVSAWFAIRENHLSCDATEACDAILAGYCASLKEGGTPFVLAEQHRWLRDLALSRLRDAAPFWQKLEALPTVRSRLPASVNGMLRGGLPEPGLRFRIVHRHAGLGSLGRRRFTALAQWRGGHIAHEAKELLASAWHWENGNRGDPEILYRQILDRAVRVPDPWIGVRGQWLLRRLAPDCSRIELSSLPKTSDELKLLRAMGWETANVHLGTKPATSRVLWDLRRRPAKWLTKAVEAMAHATVGDWKKWAQSYFRDSAEASQ
jgi:Uncharacterized protein conserved in bacteria (DUF2252)